MTIFISLRRNIRSQYIGPPRAIDVKDWRHPSGYSEVLDGGLKARVAGRKVLLVSHGFNVSYENGVRSLGALADHLRVQRQTEQFIGLLWPGDCWIPFINYPFEAEDAVTCGKNLAKYLDEHFDGACSISFASHSLGARLVLTAIENLKERKDRNPPAASLCLTAAAADDNCLAHQYVKAVSKVARVANLASCHDKVLQDAYPAGDFLSDVFYDNDSPLRGALGHRGPVGRNADLVSGGRLSGKHNYRHSDYFPKADGSGTDWHLPVDFIGKFWRDEQADFSDIQPVSGPCNAQRPPSSVRHETR